MRRKLISLIGGLAVAWPLASYSQEPKQPLGLPDCRSNSLAGLFDYLFLPWHLS